MYSLNVVIWPQVTRAAAQIRVAQANRIEQVVGPTQCTRRFACCFGLTLKINVALEKSWQPVKVASTGQLVDVLPGRVFQ